MSTKECPWGISQGVTCQGHKCPEENMTGPLECGGVWPVMECASIIRCRSIYSLKHVLVWRHAALTHRYNPLTYIFLLQAVYLYTSCTVVCRDIPSRRKQLIILFPSHSPQMAGCGLTWWPLVQRQVTQNRQRPEVERNISNNRPGAGALNSVFHNTCLHYYSHVLVLLQDTYLLEQSLYVMIQVCVLYGEWWFCYIFGARNK